MSKIKNIIKNFSIATCVLGSLYLGSPKISMGDAPITEQECLTNYSIHKTNEDCQDTYKKHFVTGTQGPVTNTPGGCENKLDDDNDGFVDNKDPDCHTSNVYNPGNIETKKDTTQFTPKPITGPDTPAGGNTDGEEGNGEEGNGEDDDNNGDDGEGKIPVHLRFTGDITYLLGNTNSTNIFAEKSGNLKTTTSGDINQINVYLQVLGNENAKVFVIGDYFNLEEKISNETFDDFGKLSESGFGIGVLAQLYFKNGKFVVEPFLSYNKSTEKLETIIGFDSEKEVVNYILGLGLRYTLHNGKNFELGAKAGVNLKFADFNLDSNSTQDDLSKNLTLLNPYGGLFVNGNVSGIPLEANAVFDYTQDYSFESQETLSGATLDVLTKFGNNFYVLAGAQIPVSSDGISTTSYLAGLGIEKITKKVPIGAKFVYLDQTENHETDAMNSDRNNQTFVFSIVYNENDWVNSTLNPITRYLKK